MKIRAQGVYTAAAFFGLAAWSGTPDQSASNLKVRNDTVGLIVCRQSSLNATTPVTCKRKRMPVVPPVPDSCPYPADDYRGFDVTTSGPSGKCTGHLGRNPGDPPCNWGGILYDDQGNFNGVMTLQLGANMWVFYSWPTGLLFSYTGNQPPGIYQTEPTSTRNPSHPVFAVVY
jgi:hypothetical protein